MVRTFAAIDVGSFELELGIYEITDKGTVRSVDQVKHMIALGKDTYNTGKISLCFELPHTSGSLYNMLGNFIFNHVNMIMIESRPIPGKNWEYRFFVDIEGNLQDAGVQNALRGIGTEAQNFKILGNY